MKLHLLCLTILSYLVLSGCQSTQTIDSTVESASTASIEVPESKDLDPDGIVCTYEKIVGKLIKEKICYTRKQKMELREESQKAAEQLERRRPPGSRTIEYYSNSYRTKYLNCYVISLIGSISQGIVTLGASPVNGIVPCQK